MDYGEKNSETRFNDPRDNLNLENWAPERDPKSLGGQAIFSNAESPRSAEVTPAVTKMPESDLGQIVDLAPTPEIPAANPVTNPARNLQPIVGSRFSDAVTTEISRAENELTQTGNISNFYDEIRDMAEIAGESWAA